MPTVFLLDCSLSMCRSAADDVDSGITRLSLGQIGLNALCDHISTHTPHEYVALVKFSSKSDLAVPFTKQHHQIKEALVGDEVYDRSDLREALEYTVDAITQEWGMFIPCHIVIVTDGIPSLQSSQNGRKQVNILFPCQIQVVVIAPREEITQSRAKPFQWISQFLKIPQDALLIPSSPLREESIQKLFLKLAQDHFAPYKGVLRCGHLSSAVSLTPSPNSQYSNVDITVGGGIKFPRLKGFTQEFPTTLEVCGFLGMAEIQSPPVLVRHLVLDTESTGSQETTDTDGVPVERQDRGNIPSFRVLLHACLKFEGMVALVCLREDWYGLMYSGSEGKNSKRSNLILSVFHPGQQIPWLGDIDYLGMKDTSKEYEDFPVGPPRTLSFQNASNLSWAGDNVIQGDFTKLVRYSRKLPEKESSFLKEFNKLRLMALTYGSQEMIDLVGVVLEKEKESYTTQHRGFSQLDKAITFLKTNTEYTKRLQ